MSFKVPHNLFCDSCLKDLFLNLSPSWASSAVSCTPAPSPDVGVRMGSLTPGSSHSKFVCCPPLALQSSRAGLVCDNSRKTCAYFYTGFLLAVQIHQFFYLVNTSTRKPGTVWKQIQSMVCPLQGNHPTLLTGINLESCSNLDLIWCWWYCGRDILLWQKNLSELIIILQIATTRSKNSVITVLSPHNNQSSVSFSFYHTDTFTPW